MAYNDWIIFPFAHELFAQYAYEFRLPAVSILLRKWSDYKIMVYRPVVVKLFCNKILLFFMKEILYTLFHVVVKIYAFKVHQLFNCQ